MNGVRKNENVESSVNHYSNNLNSFEACDSTPLLRNTNHTNHTHTGNEGVKEREDSRDERRHCCTWFSSPYFTKQRILVLIVLSFSGFFNSLGFSLLAPFFPTAAASKGATPTEIGFIFGFYPILNMISGLFFGYYMEHFGAKFLYVCGGFMMGVGFILFGCLELGPPGWRYVMMCFICRGVDAIGSGAQNTASLTVVAKVFQDRIATSTGVMSAVSTIGLVVGPPLGGVLYDVGGFLLPFLIAGVLCLIVSFFSWSVLPSFQHGYEITTKHNGTDVSDKNYGSLADNYRQVNIQQESHSDDIIEDTPEIRIQGPSEGVSRESQKGSEQELEGSLGYSARIRVLTIPSTYSLGLLGLLATLDTGFIDACLSPYIKKQFNYLPTTVGLIYLVPACTVVIFAFPIGWFADKFKVD